MEQQRSPLAKHFLYPTLLILIAADVFIWYAIVAGGPAADAEFYFLDVGQGDSQLAVIGSVQILIDGGRGPQVLRELAKAMPPQDRYLDLVVSTHPDIDHFGGLIDVLSTYQVGAFISNGRSGNAKAYADLEKAIAANGVRHIILKEGDAIRYGDAVFKILGPSPKRLAAKELNDTSLVMMLEKSGLKVLYTGDIGFDVEKELAAKYDLAAQVLKVSHHGSKFASSAAFLAEIKPGVAVIGVGKNNYGHPSKNALSRLAAAGSLILRTDQDGIVKLSFDGQKLRVYR